MGCTVLYLVGFSTGSSIGSTVVLISGGNPLLYCTLTQSPCRYTMVTCPHMIHDDKSSS